MDNLYEQIRKINYDRLIPPDPAPCWGCNEPSDNCDCNVCEECENIEIDCICDPEEKYNANLAV